MKVLDYTHQKYKKFMLDEIALSKNVLFLRHLDHSGLDSIPVSDDDMGE